MADTVVASALTDRTNSYAGGLEPRVARGTASVPFWQKHRPGDCVWALGHHGLIRILLHELVRRSH